MVVASQSGNRLPALTADEDRPLATTPTEALLALPMLAPETISERPVLIGAVFPGARHEPLDLVDPSRSVAAPNDSIPAVRGKFAAFWDWCSFKLKFGVDWARGSAWDAAS